MQVRAARADAPKKYGSALDGFENKVDMAAFDPVIYGRKMHEAAPLQMTFRAQNRRQAEQWQKRLREKITELLGGFPAQRSPLEPQTLEVREFPGYRREKFVFRAAPDMWRARLPADAEDGQAAARHDGLRPRARPRRGRHRRHRR